MLAFALIWLGLAVYTFSLTRRVAPAIQPIDQR
jgi:CcmD family protein